MRAPQELLGEFVRGRLMFLEELAKRRGLPPEEARRRVVQHMEELASTPAQKETVHDLLSLKVFTPTKKVPDWLDTLLLKAMVQVFDGPEGKLFTVTSDESCIPYEAGRFNARRQASTVFRSLYRNKTPEQWLRSSFPLIYKKCYGEEAAEHLKVEIPTPGSARLTTGRRHTGSGAGMDCATIMGYLHEGLEQLGCRQIRVEHRKCALRPNPTALRCAFELSWSPPEASPTHDA